MSIPLDVIDAPAAAALNQAEAVEALLGRLETAARQDRSPADFYEQLTRDLASALSAASASAFVETDQGLQCIQRCGTPASPTEQLTEDVERRLAAAALASGHPWLLDPGAALSEADVRNESPLLQCLAPKTAEGVPGVVLRVSLRPTAPLGLRETAGGLLNAAAEIALSYQSLSRLRQLRRRDDFWRELDDALQSIHRSTSVRSCAQAIAMEVRRLLSADRVSLLIRRGRRFRLQAVSSGTEIDRRSRQVRLLEQLAAETTRGGGSLDVHVGSGVHPLRQSEFMDAYLDETQLRSVRCEALPPPPRDDQPHRSPDAVLIVDSYTGARTEDWGERLAILAPHCAQAVDRALQWESLGWGRAWLPFRSLTRSAAWLLVLGAAAAVVAALAVVPADFTVEAPGRLMPAERRGVFAPANAIVDSVLVRDGEAVQQDQPLVRLTDPDLELESSRLQGELQTALARLDAVQARRKLKLQDRSIDSSLLSIEQEELKSTVDGLRQQLEVIRQQRERLTVSSPLTGRVARWDLEHVLQALPVRHGQILMDVYDPAGPWRLELDVPDDVSGYVREALATAPPRVDFVFETDPASIRTAVLSGLSDATDVDLKQELSVRGFVDLTEQSVPHPRRGASVTAKIYCGRRALGFVWFRELIEFVYRRILF